MKQTKTIVLPAVPRRGDLYPMGDKPYGVKHHRIARKGRMIAKAQENGGGFSY